MSIRVRVKNDEECMLVQKLFNTFGYTWPMGDTAVYDIGGLVFEHGSSGNSLDDGIIFETEESYGGKKMYWGSINDFSHRSDILSFDEFLDHIEFNGGI